jgi:hypothetical protein
MPRKSTPHLYLAGGTDAPEGEAAPEPAAMRRKERKAPSDGIAELAAARQHLIRWCYADDFDDPELDRRWKVLSAAEEALVATRATSVAGIFEKLRIYRSFHKDSDGLDWDILDSALKDAKRLAKGGAA